MDGDSLTHVLNPVCSTRLRNSNINVTASNLEKYIPVLPLERELKRELHQARRLRLDHITEVGIENFPLHRGRAEELRMVEGVKRLEAKLELAPLPDLEVTQQGQIVVRL